MLNKEKFAMFILTHGRPHDVITMQALKDSNYTGKTYIIIDNEDKQGDEYRKVFGKEMVIEFDKAAIGKTFDIADTRTDRRATVYARNASFQIAKDLGLDYHMQLDDDYTAIFFRLVEENKLRKKDTTSLNQIMEAMIDFLEDTGATSFAMSQGGDHIGGIEGVVTRPLLRKCMNTWLLRTEPPLEFVGRMNDDVNTYVVNGARGHMFFTTTALQTNVQTTQKVAGGMTEMYLNAYPMPIQRPCLNCGTLTTLTTRCEPCAKQYELKHPKKKRPHYAGDYRKRAKAIRDTATHCWLCGQTARHNDPWTADHVIAGDPASPLAPAHRSCNSSRGNRPPSPTT